MHNIQPYKYNEITFNGVKIDSVEVDKLITYFEYFDADISNAVDVEYYTTEHESELRHFGRYHHHHGEDYLIKARQLRLNHVPFKVNINVGSSVAAPATVRIYLG